MSLTNPPSSVGGVPSTALPGKQSLGSSLSHGLRRGVQAAFDGKTLPFLFLHISLPSFPYVPCVVRSKAPNKDLASETKSIAFQHHFFPLESSMDERTLLEAVGKELRSMYFPDKDAEVEECKTRECLFKKFKRGTDCMHERGFGVTDATGPRCA